MGCAETRRKEDDVPARIRKRRTRSQETEQGGGGGGGTPTVDPCGSRTVQLADVNLDLAAGLSVGTRLGWDTREGRVLVFVNASTLGYLHSEDGARLITCASVGYTYGLIWKGRRRVLIERED